MLKCLAQQRKKKDKIGNLIRGTTKVEILILRIITAAKNF